MRRESIRPSSGSLNAAVPRASTTSSLKQLLLKPTDRNGFRAPRGQVNQGVSVSVLYSATSTVDLKNISERHVENRSTQGCVGGVAA